MSTVTAANTTQNTETSCKAFRRLDPASLQPDRIHRLVIGDGSGMQVLDRETAAAELGDPFATLLLLEGRFPRNAGEVVEMFERHAPDGDPLKTASFFLGRS